MTESPKSQATTSQGLHRRYWLYLIASLGVIVIVIVGIVLMPLISAAFVERVPEPKPPIPKLKLPPPPEVLAKPHLDKAEQEAEQVVEEHLRAIDEFFSEAKKGTRPFAEEALGFWSKLLLAWEFVFRDDSHKKFIQEKFGEHIFSPGKLEEAVKQVLESYVQEVRSIENKMLVAIRADVADFPDTYPLAQLDDKLLQKRFDQAISVSMQAAKWDLGAELVSLIVAEVLTQVAVQLGVQAGILGTGATAGLGTFGIGLVVGAVVDFLVSWICDTEGNLAADLDKKLDEMNRLIVDELRNRLKQFAKERAVHRRAAVLSLLQSQGGAP